MNDFTSSSDPQQQQAASQISSYQPWFFSNIHLIGLGAEIFIFCCTFLCGCSCGKREPASLNWAILALMLFFMLAPLNLAYAQGEKAWNGLMATATVISLLQLILLVDRITHYRKSGPGGGFRFRLRFNATSIAVMASVATLIIVASSDIIWIVMIAVGWLIFIAQVVVSRRFVWMIDESKGGGPLTFEPSERIKTFGTAMTLTSVLYTLVPYLNFGVHAFTLFCPMISLVSAMFELVALHSLSTSAFLTEHTGFTSGLFIQPKGAGPVTLWTWHILITVLPFIILVYTSLKLSIEFDPVALIGFILLSFFTAALSAAVSAGPLRWFVVIKKVGKHTDDAVVVVVESTAAFSEHHTVRAYQGLIPEHMKKSKSSEGNDPNVYHITDKQAPRIVLETPHKMVEMTPADPDDLLQAIEQALVQIKRDKRSDTCALVLDFDNQDTVADSEMNSTPLREVL